MWLQDVSHDQVGSTVHLYYYYWIEADEWASDSHSSNISNIALMALSFDIGVKKKIQFQHVSNVHINIQVGFMTLSKISNIFWLGT